MLVNSEESNTMKSVHRVAVPS